MIKQNKGKDYNKVPDKYKSNRYIYYVSKKYDGNYVQIKYDADERTVKFWTSGGKEFHLHDMAEWIKGRFAESFHIECEFIYDCKGDMGDRGKSAILTTYRTNYSKGIRTIGNEDKDTFVVLDRLDRPNETFIKRLDSLMNLFYTSSKAGLWFDMPKQAILTFEEAMKMASVKCHTYNWEGVMLKCPQHIYQPGKRTNDIIKMKFRKTADLQCVDWVPGQEKYTGLIGSLICRDSKGRTAVVGSGLTDEERNKIPQYFLGEVIEIEYERIDSKYIQPTFKRVREDKNILDID